MSLDSDSACIVTMSTVQLLVRGTVRTTQCALPTKTDPELFLGSQWRRPHLL